MPPDSLRPATDVQVTELRRRYRWWLLLILVGGFLLPAMVFSPAASAHATVASSDPADGSRLAASPAQVSITFDEPVGLDLGYLKVIDSSGNSVGVGSPTHPGGQGPEIALALQPGLPNGTYIASWRVISADSHPVEGTIRFVIGDGPLSNARVAAAPVVLTSTNIAFDIARTASYLALVLLGGGWLLLTIWPVGRRSGPVRRVLVGGWLLAVLTAVGETLLQGPYAGGTGLSGVLQIHLLADTVSTNYGRMHLLRILLLAVLGVLLDLMLSSGHTTATSTATTLRRGLPGVVAFLALIFTFSQSGHAAVARPGWLALGSDMLHLAAMSTWIGGLVMLTVGLLPARDPEDLQTVLPVFSRVAMVCVAVLATTGTYQAWRESGTVKALTTTTYGLLVLLKAALFLGLIVLGNVSRRAIQRRYVRGKPDDSDTGTTGSVVVRRMRRSVLAELVIAAVVLAASGVLVAQAPGRTAVAATPAPAATATAAVDGTRTVRITVSPGRHGIVSVDVALQGGAAPQHITVSASLPVQQLGPLPVPLEGTGLTFHADGVLLPAAGRWTFTVTVQTDEFDATTTDLQIPIS